MLPEILPDGRAQLRGLYTNIEECLINDNIDEINALLESSTIRAMLVKQILLNVCNYPNSILRFAVSLGSNKIVTRFFELASDVTDEIKFQAGKTAIFHKEMACLQVVYKQAPHLSGRLLLFVAKHWDLVAVNSLLQLLPSDAQSSEWRSDIISLIEHLCVNYNLKTRSADDYLLYADLIGRLLRLKVAGHDLIEDPNVAAAIAPYLIDDLVNTVMYEYLNDDAADNTRGFTKFLQNLCDVNAVNSHAALPAFDELQTNVVAFVERMVAALELTLQCRAQLDEREHEVTALKQLAVRELELPQWRGELNKLWKRYKSDVAPRDRVSEQRYSCGIRHFALS